VEPEEFLDWELLPKVVEEKKSERNPASIPVSLYFMF